MEWVKNFEYILLDLDGTLVNTELLHYQAYQDMCSQRGFKLPWSFRRYCFAGHQEASGLKDQIYEELPLLKEQEPDWLILYQEKKTAYLRLLNEGHVGLMPGVEDLLKSLKEHQILSCVVTHSPDEQVSWLRQQHPILNTIPHWITRHDYTNSKPHPESYLLAIEKFGKGLTKIIGFEDTPKGLRALKKTRALSVFLCAQDYPFLEQEMDENTLHFTDFLSIPKNFSYPS
jgi:beta-phosphoglucomutase